MDQAETNRFDELYQRHLRLLKLQGKSQKTIDAYAQAVRRISKHFDCCPDQLTLEQREKYFADLVESHSWSTVKIDRNGLQFFWKHVLERDWQWVNIVKAPKVRSLPDILTTTEVEQLIGATRNLRYRVFLLATYSMRACGSRRPWRCRRAMWTVSANWFISLAARATRIVWSLCRISPFRHCGLYGASIAIPAGCSPMPWAQPSASAAPPRTWIAAALRLP